MGGLLDAISEQSTSTTGERKIYTRRANLGSVATPMSAGSYWTGCPEEAPSTRLASHLALCHCTSSATFWHSALGLMPLVGGVAQT
jgi:hypothetical protein